MKKHQHINPFTDLDLFIGGLQKEDNRNLKMTRNFQWVMWALVLIYAIVFLIIPDKEMIWSKRLGGLFYVLAFALFALVFRKLNSDYRSLDYGVSTVEMLKKAIIRYRFLHRKLSLIIAPILLIDAAMVLVLYHPELEKNILQLIIQTQLLLFSSIGIGLIIGIFIWRKRQKPLRDAAKAMLKEIES